MLAPQGEPEGAELLSDSEGHGSGKEPGRQPRRTLRRRGVLAPYWAERLHKKELHAFQLSERGGELFCTDKGDRVGIGGRAVTYLSGHIRI